MITWNGTMMEHLNSFSGSGGWNLNKNFAKNTNARGLPGGGGRLKLRFDWYIRKKRVGNYKIVIGGRRSLCHLPAQLPLRCLNRLIAGKPMMFYDFYVFVREGSSSYARLKLQCMPDQDMNDTITQERYKSNAYVWRIVRLEFTFLTRKIICLI